MWVFSVVLLFREWRWSMCLCCYWCEPNWKTGNWNGNRVRSTLKQKETLVKILFCFRCFDHKNGRCFALDHSHTMASIARYYKISACGYYNLLCLVPPIPAFVGRCKLPHYDTKCIDFIERRRAHGLRAWQIGFLFHTACALWPWPAITFISLRMILHSSCIRNIARRLSHSRARRRKMCVAPMLRIIHGLMHVPSIRAMPIICGCRHKGNR